MIGIAKTVDEEERNDFGFPRATITLGEKSPLTSTIDQSVNKALPYVAFSWFLSGGAIIGLILMALLMPGIVASKVAEAVAQAKAEMSENVASANESANSARMFGRLANEKADRVLAQLEARGLVKQENH